MTYWHKVRQLNDFVHNRRHIDYKSGLPPLAYLWDWPKFHGRRLDTPRLHGHWPVDWLQDSRTEPTGWQSHAAVSQTSSQIICRPDNIDTICTVCQWLRYEVSQKSELRVDLKPLTMWFEVMTLHLVGLNPVKSAV